MHCNLDEYESIPTSKVLDFYLEYIFSLNSWNFALKIFKKIRYLEIPKFVPH